MKLLQLPTNKEVRFEEAKAPEEAMPPGGGGGSKGEAPQGGGVAAKEGGGGVAAQEGAQEGKGGGVAAQEGAQEGMVWQHRKERVVVWQHRKEPRKERVVPGTSPGRKGWWLGSPRQGWWCGSPGRKGRTSALGPMERSMDKQ